MTHFTFRRLGNYTNNGQDIEQSIRYAMTGAIEKADNLRHDLGSDCNGYQIKSARATVCKGTDIRAYLATDASNAYIYGTLDGTAYVMTTAEYITFVDTFGTTTRESAKNGGAEKIRLGHETKKMLEWLKAKA